MQCVLHAGNGQVLMKWTLLRQMPLFSVQHADLGAAFLGGIHCLLEKIVLILLTNFEDNIVTVIGGLCVFSPPHFSAVDASPQLFSNKGRELAMSEERQMKQELISVFVFW